MGIYKQQELILKNRVSKVALKQLERLHGIRVKLIRSSKNVYSKVYGMESGDDTGECEEMTVLITSDTFSPMDRFNAGLLTEGWLFTSTPEKVFVGDTVEVARADNKAFKFKIISKEAIGVTETVSEKFRLSALGEGNLSEQYKK